MEEIGGIINEVRTMTARGDFRAARRRLQEAVEAGNEDLRRHALTLEVLESIDVVRRLLREGRTDAAARAGTTILDALNRDEYARLGVVGAALALLGRAGEVARRSGPSPGPEQRAELNAFVDHLGTELDALGRESVDRPLQALQEPELDQTVSTLGDLLSRKPWRSEASSSLDAIPDSPRRDPGSGRAQVPVLRAQDGSPVIGRILIEQEERERVSSAPQTSTSGSGSQDLFELVGRAALENWHVVLFSTLLFAALGYLGVMAAPDRYESTALLQRTQQSNLRAPITQRPQAYVPSLPPRTVMQLVRLPAFHERVSSRLENKGWADGEDAAPEDFRTYAVSAQMIAASLMVRIEDTGSNTYMIEFRAEHPDAAISRAIAGAASDEFRDYHFEHITREANANLHDYTGRRDRIAGSLDEIHTRRLAEFQITDVEALGVSLDQRINTLIQEINASRGRLSDARLELKAAREELDAQVGIAERLPQYIQPEDDIQIETRMELLRKLETEMRELSRLRAVLGPAHPKQRRISELEEEIELLKAEIQELEKTREAEESGRKLNPDRAIAEDRVAKARFRVTLSEDRVRELEARIPRLEAELQSLRGSWLESEQLRRHERDLLEQQARNDVVLEEIQAVISSADRELALVSPASAARKVEKDVLVGIAVGMILGLVVGIGVAIGLLRRRQAAKVRMA